MPFEHTISLFPFGFSHLLGGAPLPSAERSPFQSLYSSLSFGVWIFSYWLDIFHLLC